MFFLGVSTHFCVYSVSASLHLFGCLPRALPAFCGATMSFGQNSASYWNFASIMVFIRIHRHIPIESSYCHVCETFLSIFRFLMRALSHAVLSDPQKPTFRDSKAYGVSFLAKGDPTVEFVLP